MNSVHPQRKPAPTAVGSRIPPAANARYVAGKGLYTDDVAPAGALHMALVRSPHACAAAAEGHLTEGPRANRASLLNSGLSDEVAEELAVF
jgi:CO/xanthine dehydrogenase Mo-binding subunit